MTALPSLEEDYELGAELGRGGFGVVLEGTRKRDGVGVAVKLPHQELAPDDLARIQREARLLGTLRSPHLAGLHGLLHTREGLVALVYDRVPGTSLAERAAAEPPRVDEVIRWVTGVAAGLATLHEAGLVHRDVKPENVHVTPEGHAVLLDFGMLRPATGETVTATGMVLGTPEFLAPEQIRGERAGPSADVYALGCLLYELLEGRPPFRGSLPEVLGKQLNTPPPPARSDLGGATWPLLEALLSKDPAARPSATQVGPLLRRGLGELTGKASRSSERAPNPMSRATRVRRASLRPTPRGPSRQALRRPRRRLVLGLFLAIALGAFLAEPRPPAAEEPASPRTTQAPVLEGDAAFDRLLTELNAELEWARGAYVDGQGELVPPDGDLGAPGVAPLLEPDPARFGFVALHMPVLSRCFEWLRGGPFLAHELPEALRGQIQDYEERFASAGMPRAFHPVMQLTPATEPYPVPEAFRLDIAQRVVHDGTEALPEVVDGWLARAASEAWDLQKEFQELEPRVISRLNEGRPPAGVPSIPRHYLRLRLHRTFERFVREVGDDPRVRRQLLGWNRSLQRAFLRVLLATGRAVEGGQRGAPVLAHWVRERLRDWSIFQPIAMRPGPPELLVGGRVTQRSTRVLLAGLLENLYNIRGDWGAPRDPAELLRRRLLEEPRPAPPPAGPFIPLPLLAQLQELTGLYEELGEDSLLLDTFRAWQGDLPRLNPGTERTVLLDVGEAYRSSGGLDAAEVERLRELSCALARRLEGTDADGGDKLVDQCEDLRR